MDEPKRIGTGKPGPGRPKGRRTQRIIDGENLCREIFESAGGSQALQLLAQSDDERIRLDALKLLLEHAYGKPRQRVDTVSLNLTPVQLDTLSDEELLAYRNKLAG